MKKALAFAVLLGGPLLLVAATQIDWNSQIRNIGGSASAGAAGHVLRSNGTAYVDGQVAPGDMSGAGSAGHVVRSTGTVYADSALQSADIPNNAANTTGTSANVTGVVLEANGGTGNANTPGAAGHVLRSNATHYVDSAIQIADVPSLYAAGGGTAQAQTATYSPANASLTAGLRLCWLPTAANTAAAPTFAPDGLTAHSVVRTNGGALVANDLLTTVIACATYNLGSTRWELQNPQTGVSITSQTVEGGSRAINTVYQNTTGRPLWVQVTCVMSSAGAQCIGESDSSNTPSTQVAAFISGSGLQGEVSFWVLPGNYYEIVTNGTVSAGLWVEYS